MLCSHTRTSPQSNVAVQRQRPCPVAPCRVEDTTFHKENVLCYSIRSGVVGTSRWR